MGFLAQSVIARNIISEAVASLRGRRLQVALSSFGIATGIAAVVLLVSIVSGMHRYAIEQFSAVGGNIIRVTVNPERSTRDPRGFTATMRLADVDAVMASVPYYDAAMADNSGFGVLRTARRSSQGATIRGITPSGFELLAVQSERGRFFLPHEYEMGTRVAVLGADVASDVFSGDSAVGQTMLIGEWPYLVVGVLDWVGDPDAGDASSEDRSVFVPFKACAATFRGTENANSLYFRLKSAEDPAAAVIATRTVLDGLRKQRGETTGSYNVISSIERMGELNLVLNAIKMVVGLVGGIGLFVGAVGVANVLLVSVRERRAEIGTRRAVGATRRAIFVGFLFEALAMTLSGGTIGIFVAWALTKIAILIPSVPVGARPVISPATALTALALLTVVGLVAGVWPAKRAAAVYPAEALRAD
jgi:putative ABC transport system permease protein